MTVPVDSPVGSDTPVGWAAPAAPESAKQPTPVMADTALVFSDQGAPIAVQAGSTFSLLLESNASTGYSWALADSLSPGLLRQVSHQYEQGDNGAASGPPVVGAPGHERWTFEAVGAGTTAIRMAYARPWEREAAPADTARFEVTIR